MSHHSRVLLIAGLLIKYATAGFSQDTTTAGEKELGGLVLLGMNKPNRIVPVSTQTPVGFELRYSRLQANQQSWEQCQCFFRAGFFINAYAFRNPIALGQSIGGGLFFEPILFQRSRWEVSARALAGVTYVSRSHDDLTNPGNDAFGTPINGLIGGGLSLRYRLSPGWRILAGFDYKHISNAGVRLPNQGLNIPALAVGIMRYTGTAVLPNTAGWRMPSLRKRWMVRILALGSVKVLSADRNVPEQGYPIVGLNVLAGYHLSRAHVISGGVEVIDDRSFKEQIYRWTGQYQTYRQGTFLAGYEFWQGHFSFTAHMGWNVIRPQWYKPAVYQKYGLLYRFANGLTGGVIVKTFGDDTKNFQLAVGKTF